MDKRVNGVLPMSSQQQNIAEYIISNSLSVQVEQAPLGMFTLIAL
jgi:hypothetical protein